MMGKAQFSLEPHRNLSFIAWITAMQKRTAATLTEKISLVLLPPHPCFHTHFFDLFQCCQLFSPHTHTVPIFESTTVDVLSSLYRGSFSFIFPLMGRGISFVKSRFPSNLTVVPLGSPDCKRLDKRSCTVSVLQNIHYAFFTITFCLLNSCSDQQAK